ncbi:amino acid ABC transporter permease, partial [Acinetobacter baumannii]|nr:amino acid ABC transporter permease [Acinetobacter baumannii]
LLPVSILTSYLEHRSRKVSHGT